MISIPGPRRSIGTRNRRAKEGPELFRGFGQVLIALVLLPRPEEAFQSVAFAARHDMDVQVRNALAYMVIDGDESALCAQRLLDRAFKILDSLKERSELRLGQIGQRDDVPAGDQQNVSGEQRPVV